MQQVFQNLIANALKYRTAQPSEIKVTAIKKEREWLLSVHDNGIGIDPQYHEQIFGLFKRLHPAKRYAGTGIGLAICRKIIESYGGRIWVESRPGDGATFFFSLPEIEVIPSE
jgi:light-regulated signal transduction histidine kinase (bacteriophytochrome)